MSRYQNHPVVPSHTLFSNRGPAIIAIVFALALLLTACGKTYPNCDDDELCAAKGEVCVNNTCRQCRDDSQCAALDACMGCEANICVRRAGCCKSDLDCPDGKCWKETEARLTGVCGGSCKSNDHCPAGQRCAGGSCVPSTTCEEDTSCPGGHKCVRGICVTSACQLQDLRFDFNQHTVRGNQRSVLEENARCIVENSMAVELVGHSDETGSDEYNLALGQRRAAVVASQYRALGVPGSKIVRVLSYGEEAPACVQMDETCHDENRRVETLPR